ncbi:MAG: lytic transglycosylase domain-containing protein [Candidatus Sulfotelmatobacter sp.]
MRLALKLGTWIPALLVLAAALPCFAGEVAVLRNGFSIRHERREVIGDTTRLYVTADGSSFVDVPTAEIEHFEAAPPESPTPEPRLAASGAQAKSPLLAKYARNGAPGASVFPESGSVDLNEMVDSASRRYWLDPDLVKSVIKAESGFNVRAVSQKGAQGLMQLMPGTASQLGVPNAFDPEANVEGGTKYLRELLERYNFDLVKALAAYNAGPLRVEQFGGVPPYYETRAYVARVVRDFNKKKAAEQGGSRQTAPSKKSAAHVATKTSHGSGTVTQTKASAAQERE